MTPRSVVMLPAAVALWVAALATPAHAGPREDMRAAYDQALRQFNELELEAAMQTVEGGIAAAEGAGAGQDPTLASLYLLKAALIYSNEGDAAKSRIVAEMEKGVRLNYYVVIPVEVRSDGMTRYLQQAQKKVGAAPAEPIAHQTPGAACGQDLHIEALLGVPDGGLAALYWRVSGGGEFNSVEMTTFSNVAEYTIGAAEHRDQDLEYFIFAFDANSQPIANKGTQEDPIRLTQGCPVGGGATDGPTEGPTEGPEEPGEDEPDKPKGPKDTLLPRVWINVGLGTGFGIARGTAEQTYEQYFPADDTFVYGAPQAACAMARWYAGDGPLPAPAEAGPIFQTYGGQAQAADLSAAYNPTNCAAHHPVRAGMAPALFHIAPEIQFRVAKRLSLALFTRLQVVTGARVLRDDPEKQLGQPASDGMGGFHSAGSAESEAARAAGIGTSFWDDVYSPSPPGFTSKPPFTWAVGLKLRYYLLDDMKKFRLFVGGFAGYGNTRLRVDMGFGDDKNGNSVPDEQEAGADAPFVNGGYDLEQCYPVWPYQNGCTDQPGMGDNALAVAVAQGANGTNRIDTVRLGPGFVGLLFGFNYQLHKNFALYGELDVGGWFPDAGSVLFDLTVGPAISF
jgi:hypothetical protein